ncbi:MAG: RICIN domain-containing protein [Snowella sp.]|nr:RICIN domain-containing protein [Snowella sp.]
MPILENNKLYAIRPRHANENNRNSVLAVRNASLDRNQDLCLYRWTGGDEQRWYAIDKGNETYKFIAKHSGQCMEVYTRNNDTGAIIVQYPEQDNDTAQLMKLEPAGGIYYYIRPQNSRLYVSVKDQSLDDGAAVNQWSLTSVTNQVFEFVKV